MTRRMRALILTLILIVLVQSGVIYWQYKVHSNYQSSSYTQLFSEISLTLLDVAAYKKTGDNQALARLEAELAVLSLEDMRLRAVTKGIAPYSPNEYYPPNAAVSRYLRSGGSEKEMKEYLTKIESSLQGYLDSRISYKENKDNAYDFLSVWREVMSYGEDYNI